MIKRITAMLNPRIARLVALAVPNEKEKTQWYFQHAMGFCSEKEYWEFLRSCPRFVEMLLESGIILIKYWFSVTDEAQEKRFSHRINDPLQEHQAQKG